MIDIGEVMNALSKNRPVFHSEADFQHALAWLLHRLVPESRLRLEYKPFPKQRFYLDIWVGGESSVAVELKYLTRGLEVDIAGEHFELANQAAQDISRYDFLKDLVRLESVVAALPNTIGYAVLLTNDSAYWKHPLRDSSIDASFRIHEGRSLGGEHSWAGHAGQGTIAKREKILALTGSYSIAWQDYARVSSKPYGLFRYLAIPINAGVTGDFER